MKMDVSSSLPHMKLRCSALHLWISFLCRKEEKTWVIFSFWPKTNKKSFFIFFFRNLPICSSMAWNDLPVAAAALCQLSSASSNEPLYGFGKSVLCYTGPSASFSHRKFASVSWAAEVLTSCVSSNWQKWPQVNYNGELDCLKAFKRVNTGFIYSDKDYEWTPAHEVMEGKLLVQWRLKILSVIDAALNVDAGNRRKAEGIAAARKRHMWNLKSIWT